MFTDEEEQIREVIIASRRLEEYLWGEYNGKWNIEEWRRMFRKRIKKMLTELNRMDIISRRAKIRIVFVRQIWVEFLL